MGLESFDLVTTCCARLEVVANTITSAFPIAVQVNSSTTSCHYEICHSDYIVELLLLEITNGQIRVSLRCALCCDSGVIDPLLRLAKLIGQTFGQSLWRVFQDNFTIDIESFDAASFMLEAFELRRRNLLDSYGIKSLRSAALRAGPECLDYLMKHRVG